MLLIWFWTLWVVPVVPPLEEPQVWIDPDIVGVVANGDIRTFVENRMA